MTGAAQSSLQTIPLDGGVVELRYMQPAEMRRAFPDVELEDAETFYYWARVNVLGRPVFLLSQRVVAKADRIPIQIHQQPS